MPMSSNSYTALIDSARRSLRAGDHFDAAAGFHRAALAAKQEGLQNECAYALRHSAIAEIEVGNFEKALGDSHEALEIYEAIDGAGSLNIANTHRLIALASEGLGQSTQAQDHWKTARDIYHANDIEDGVTECDQHLAT